ncbi:MAG TPA: protein-disulfide reductase DsbD domain-containing protein [Bauldia sp.]|nr:protein-disulfide reductase DsbD domain-containing protein [Bauldia sp.]
MMRPCQFLLALLLSLGAWPASAAQPGFGAWSEGAEARVRLISGGIGEDGRLLAGIEIMLSPGWWTYWRTPGASGIPPRFDFAGSKNLGAVEVSFPLPERHEDGYGASNVYEGGVLLPLSADVPDPSAPTELRLSIDLGVCEEVCVPDHVEATLIIPPGMKDRVAAATLAGARAQVPGPPEPGALMVEQAWRSGGSDKRPEFDITVTAPEDAAIFVEGPADWFPGAPKRITDAAVPTYRVAFDRIGARTPIEGASLRVTLAANGRAIEQIVPIE